MPGCITFLRANVWGKPDAPNFRCRRRFHPWRQVMPEELEAVLAELEAQQRDALAQLVAEIDAAWAAWLEADGSP